MTIFCILVFAAMIGVMVTSAVELASEFDKAGFRMPRLTVSHRRVGGLHFWRVGNLGGSFYIAKGN